jgi:4-amino-4-deoxy-L-arabinose transferase-like glycosyltransferase
MNAPVRPGDGSAARPRVEGPPRSSSLVRVLLPACSAAVVLVVTAYRLHAVRDATFPGHADKSFYFGVAQNLSAGRGPNVDYVWHFLTPQHHLTHFAFDYWLPLNSMLMAGPLWLFHGDLPTALSVEVVLAAVVALATALIARELTDIRWIPPVAAVVVILTPAITDYSVQAEASMAFAATGALAFAAALHARTRPWLWLVAGALAGLAHLSRNEGLLLAGSVILCSITWPTKVPRIRNALMAAGAYVAVMAPYCVVSIAKLGAPLPPASTYFPFVTNFEDLYRSSPLPGPRDVRAIGLRGNLDLRLDALVGRWSDLFTQNGVIVSTTLLILIGVAIGTAPRDRRSPWWNLPWLLPIAYGIAVALLYIVVTPAISATGAWVKTLPLLLPFIVTAALVGVARVTKRGAFRVCLVALLIVPSLTQLSSETRSVIRGNNFVGLEFRTLTPILKSESACVEGEVVVMTRYPWELTQATGFRSVQIPNAPVGEIRKVAERWGVTDILVSAKRPQLIGLAQLERVRGDLYRYRSPRTTACRGSGSPAPR